MIQTSYDIVKAHGGELKVETLPAGKAGKEGDGLPAEALAQAGSEFIISLPIIINK